MNLRASLLFASLAGCFPLHAEEPLADLIARLGTTADEGKGINEAEQELAKAIAPHNTAAADLLLPLLKSDNKDVRQLAAYCLFELPAGSLLERHLPALTKACREERGWLPHAIADIGSDAALAFLAAEFRREPQTHAQIDHALIHTAPRSVPHLLHELAVAEEGDTKFLETLPALWPEMAANAAAAVEPLLAMARDDAAPLFRRQCAIASLGAIGPAAKAALPPLKALAEANPALADAVQQAIQKLRDR
ncbi:hypothetical protein [Haloferula sp. BvORR071]|uniref:hypothetical protein n=1 Tax=Haloferula sp. BvORR071 TaxID=1396141 RepID=UPI000558735F|nr:hypothetical protein [Haloferula sp. BvORR071]